MSSFGRFQIVEELERRGPYAVSSARADGQSGDPAFAIKTYRNEGGLLDEDVFERESGRFIECAALQKELAASGGKDSRWAPIHGSGRVPDAAYYVTDLYPATLSSLIDRRRVMTPREIARMMTQVVEGLEALLKAKGRAHGRLTSSNVLVNNATEMDEAGVFLTDPAHQRELGGRSAEGDINALGALIFALVMYRAAPKGGSIAHTPEWRHYRAQGEALRALCEKLINVQSAAEMPLEQVKAKLAEIPGLKGAKGKSPLPIIAAAGVLVLGGAVAGGYFTNWYGLVKPPVVVPELPPIVGKNDPREAGGARSQWLLKQLADISDEVNKARDQAIASEDVLNEIAARRNTLSEEARVARDTVQWPDVASAGAGLPDAERRAAQEAKVKEQEELAAKFADIAGRVDSLAKEVPAAVAQAQADVASGKAKPISEKWRDYRETEVTTARAALDKVRDLLTQEGGQGAQDLATIEAQIEAAREAISTVLAMPEGTPETNTAKTEASRVVGRDLRAIPDAIERVGKASADRLAAYIESQRTTATRLQGDSAKLAAAFRKVFESLAEGSATYTWTNARQALEGLEPWLTAIDASLPKESGVAGVGATLVDPKPFEDAFGALKVRVVESLADEMARTGVVPNVNGPEFAAQLKREGDPLKAWASGAVQIAGASKRIEEALANAFGATEPIESGKAETIASLRDGIAAQVGGGGAYAAQASAVAPVLAKVRELEQVNDAASPALLAQIPADAGALAAMDRAKVLAAWDRLNEAGWPATASDLDQAKSLSANVKAVAAQIASRGGALSARVDERLKDMWKGFAGERAGADPESVNKAYSTREAFAISDADVAALPSAMRFNFALIEARQSLNGFNTRVTSAGPTELAELAGLLEGMSGNFKALGVDARLGDLVPTLDQRAQRFRAGKAGVSWADIGPGKGAVGPWTVGDNDDNDGTYVVYQWTGPSGTAWSIRFNRVNVQGPREVTYMATGEVPLGFFADLVAASGRAEEFSRLVKASSEVAKLDARGPLGWATSGATSTFKLSPAVPAGPLSANGWIVSEQAIPGISTLYPAGVNPEPPNARTPLQYISPMTATVAAGLVGCRLPLRAEMEAAMALDTGSPNLRDSSWSAVFATFKAANDGAGAGKAGWPNGQILTSEGTQEANPGGADGAAAVASDDGVVWFRGVDMAAGTFRDLVGNVAEYVIADPADVTTITDEYVRNSRNLRTLGSKLGVMGGSAISPASMPTNEFVGLTALNASGLKAGFSDVGFRLAFSSSEAGGGAGAQPGKSVYDRLMRQAFLANP